MKGEWEGIACSLLIALLLVMPVSAHASSLSVHSGHTTAQTSLLDNPKSGPFVEKITYNVITQDDQQVLALLDDEIDLIGDIVEPESYNTLTNAENVEVTEVLRNGYGYLTINCAKYPFNITAFRRAFAFALDKESISNDIWDGFSVPQDSCVPQINPASIEGQLPYTYYYANIALGNQLLDAAGFLDIDDDDIREAPDGTEFDVMIELAASSNIAIEVSQKGVEAFVSLGINASSKPQDFYGYLNRLYFHGDYDIYFAGSTFQDFDLDWLAYEFWSEYADEPYYNFPNFQNASYDSWRDQLLHSTDYDKVLEAAQEMQKIWVYESPMIILYENHLLSAYRTDRFEGFVNNALGGVPGWWTNYQVQLKEGQGGPYGGTFRWSNPLDLDTFNFMVSSSKYTMNVLGMLYDSLLKQDPNGNLINWLADSYIIETHDDNAEVIDGHTRITFDVVKNASWSDGKAISANDVSFTLNYYLQDSRNPYGRDLNEVTSIYAPRDYTVVIEFETESYWHLSSVATKPILPYHIFNTMDREEWNLWHPDPLTEQIVTSGPYYISDYVPGEYTELSINDYYFRSPKITFTEPDVGYITNGESIIPGTSELSVENQYTPADGGGGELTWTSYANSIPSPIQNSSELSGEQIVLNATWPAWQGVDNVSLILVKVSNNDVIERKSFLGRSGTIDVYDHATNDVYNFTAIAKTHDSEFRITVNVTITIHFVPTITLLTPNSGVISGDVFIRWSIEDNNTLDTHYTDVAISRDNGLTYQLYAKGVTSSSFLWTIAGWALMESYRVKVTVRDSFGFSDYDFSEQPFTAGSDDIVDDATPIIIGEESHGESLDFTGNSFEWLAFDLHPLSYEIWYEDAILQSGNWDSGLIQIDCDQSVKGLFNYTLRVTDESGNENSMTTWVVSDVTIPSIYPAEDVVYTQGEPGGYISWMTDDDNPASFSIERNDTELDGGNWNGGNITVSIEGVAVGVYEYTLTVIDDDGLMDIDSVIVTILARPEPAPLDMLAVLSLVITIASLIIIIAFGIPLYRTRKP